MSFQIDRAKMREIKERISHKLTDLCRTGYYFCPACQHVTEVDVEHEYPRCVICRSPRVRWNPPVFSESELENLADHATPKNSKAA